MKPYGAPNSGNANPFIPGPRGRDGRGPTVARAPNAEQQQEQGAQIERREQQS